MDLRGRVNEEIKHNSPSLVEKLEVGQMKMEGPFQAPDDIQRLLRPGFWFFFFFPEGSNNPADMRKFLNAL